MLSSAEYQAVFHLRAGGGRAFVHLDLRALPRRPSLTAARPVVSSGAIVGPMAIRRVVTGFETEGKGVVLLDGPAPAEWVNRGSEVCRLVRASVAATLLPGMRRRLSMVVGSRSGHHLRRRRPA